MTDTLSFMETALTGVIDPYLLSPLGRLDGTNLKITAVCSGLPYAKTANAVILLNKESNTILVGIASLTEIGTHFLDPIEITTLTDFINKYCLSLNDHWLGTIDSVELGQRLAGSRLHLP